VADLAVAVGDQAVEQLGQAHGGAGAAVALQGLAQGGVQAGGAGQVVAGAAQDQLPRGREALVALVGQDGDEAADELPPVADGGPGQVVQLVGQLGILVVQLGILDDGGGAQELEGGLPEVVGGQVALQGGLGILGAAAQLGQRQGQARHELLVQDKAVVHGGLSLRQEERVKLATRRRTVPPASGSPPYPTTLGSRLFFGGSG
jgi:hypothetical protein